MTAQPALLPLQHQPIRMRPGARDGEVIYARRWRELMEGPAIDTWDGPASPFERVLGDFPGAPTDRIACVVATIVTWLGTNCGQALLHMARSNQLGGRGRESHAYLMAWYSDNLRKRGIDRGYRLLEHLMAGEDDRDPKHGWLNRAPVLTIEDYEAAEHLMLWLATSDGQTFLRAAENEIEHTLQERSRRELERFTAGR